jgi:hypothetical protein
MKNEIVYKWRYSTVRNGRKEPYSGNFNTETEAKQWYNEQGRYLENNYHGALLNKRTLILERFESDTK